jgi:hypothetical protein
LKKLFLTFEKPLMFAIAKEIVPLLDSLIPWQMQTAMAALHTVYRFNGLRWGIF